MEQSVEVGMLTSLEICGIEARVKHCRARLKLNSNGQLRRFLQSMIDEAEEILAEMSHARGAVSVKVRREDNILRP